MKGISPIIAIVIILLVTIAIAGAAYSYISIVWAGTTTKVIQVTGITCSSGAARIYIKNMGTDPLANTDFVVYRDGNVLAEGATADYTIDASVDQGDKGTIAEVDNDPDTTECGADKFCRYSITVGGRVYRADVQC